MEPIDLALWHRAEEAHVIVRDCGTLRAMEFLHKSAGQITELLEYYNKYSHTVEKEDKAEAPTASTKRPPSGDKHRKNNQP